MSAKPARPEQLPLALPHRPARGREDFLVAPCNEAAVAWIDRWPDWPAPALTLYGPEGSGKTHLLHVWAEAAGAPVWSAADLRVEGLDERLGARRWVAVDAADAAAEPDALFHLFNMLRERSGAMLAGARVAPARWTMGTADLRSRLAAAPSVALGTPDDALLGAVLMKLFADRQLPVAPELIEYLSARMPRTFEAALSLVDRLDRMALAERKGLTLPLARRALESLDESE
ncbi:MAG: DnaA/Hda family protein [Marivibrio sp.]|uniref:HdaA/DnaA family protein n=1 Tax=Marivibrio sp. TaxID=2039719 RepID=UPI0032EE5B66